MDVLVTGEAGFIGGHLSERLIRDGHDVSALDQLHEYYDLGIKRQTIEQCRQLAAESDGSYEFIQGDVRDETLVDRLVDAADYVYVDCASTHGLCLLGNRVPVESHCTLGREVLIGHAGI